MEYPVNVGQWAIVIDAFVSIFYAVINLIFFIKKIFKQFIDLIYNVVNFGILRILIKIISEIFKKKIAHVVVDYFVFGLFSFWFYLFSVKHY